MKRKFVMFTVLISGPKQPKNKIDVCLELLVEDLRLLWATPIKVFDAHLREKFTLRAVLLWTMNDFSSYRNMSSCVVKGYKDTHGVFLNHSRKVV